MTVIDSSPQILDVWNDNLQEGLQKLRTLHRANTYVAVDTEFPGVVARPYGQFPTQLEYSYAHLKLNAELLKPIQVGFSFFNEKGEQPSGEPHTIQFNFRWNINVDTYAQDSIDLLRSSGIKFDKMKTDGIDVEEFAEGFISSGMALNSNLVWICYHCPYDWAYMLKICTNWVHMPTKWSEFFEFVSLFFPNFIDIKVGTRFCTQLKGGLQELADQLNARRIGMQHQAGSDAQLTGEAFFKLRAQFFDNSYDKSLMNLVYGFNDNCLSASNGTAITNGTASPASLCPLPGNSEGASPTAQSSSASSPRTSPVQSQQTQNGTSSNQTTMVTSGPVTVNAANGSTCGSSSSNNGAISSSPSLVIPQPIAVTVAAGETGH